MSDTFNQNATGNQAIAPVNFWFGGIIEDNGELKLEWTDQGDGETRLLDESDLVNIEHETRMALISCADNLNHVQKTQFRNMHYSAEYGLVKLQQAKQDAGKRLTTPFKHIVR